MLASGVATTAWHLTRAGDARSVVVAAAGPAVTPSRSATTPVAPGASAARPATVRPRPERAAPPADRAPRTPARSTPPVTRSPQPEARPYGPFACERQIAVNWETTLLVSQCHAIGPKIQFQAVLTPAGTGTATVTVALRSEGRTVAGPHRCAGLAFAERGTARECGPWASGAVRGRRYSVRMTWAFVRDGRTINGAKEGSAFTF
jgi:serine/threonine-protein kinase